jgi:hypothetical protein
MALLEQWNDYALNPKQDKATLQKFWDDYFAVETQVYQQLLSDPDAAITGTVAELAEKFGLDLMTMTGFLDGINDSLKTPNPLDTMEADTVVSLDFDKEKLFRNMVEAKADWLYGLPQWDDIFDKETQKRLIAEQKRSHTVRNTVKVGRNDPCPCGSGKKYKFCCGKRK